MVKNRLKKLSIVSCGALLFGLTFIDSANAAGFTGPYSQANWSNSGIRGGSSNLNLVDDTGNFDYSVNLGGGGVSRRNVRFLTTAADTGTVNFDWDYSGFHAFFRAFAEFQVIRNGNVVLDLVNRRRVRGNFNFNGVSESFSVNQGDSFGFRIGGQNFDSNSRLRGNLAISNFEAPTASTASTFESSSVLGLLVLGGIFGISQVRKKAVVSKAI